MAYNSQVHEWLQWQSSTTKNKYIDFCIYQHHYPVLLSLIINKFTFSITYFLITIHVLIITEFLTHPDNTTVVHGTEVEFSCVAVEADVLSFLVDGIPEPEPNVTAKGFIPLGTEYIDPTTIRRNLTATALTQYNNTKIQCLAIDTGNTKQLYSDSGTLLIQGILSLRPISLY